LIGKTGGERLGVVFSDELERRSAECLICFTMFHGGFLVPRGNCLVGKPDSLDLPENRRT
jgi:hypothetical protein